MIGTAVKKLLDKIWTVDGAVDASDKQRAWDAPVAIRNTAVGIEVGLLKHFWGFFDAKMPLGDSTKLSRKNKSKASLFGNS